MSHKITFALDDSSWIEQGTLPATTSYNFDALWQLHPEEYGKVYIHGKLISTPRWQQSYMKPYWFSGMNHPAKELPDLVMPFLDWVNKLYETKWVFNQVLINWYADGHHYIGPHADDEKQLVPGSPIISLSLGETRKFRIRDKNERKIVKDIDMPNETCIAMCGEMQKHYLHEVPKITGNKGIDMGKRINITFQVFM